MEETRAGKYGRNLAIWIEYTIDTIPEKEDYKKKLIQELQTYSFEPKKKGQPNNSGTVYELSDLLSIDVNNPEDLAKLIKEGIHLMYQKQTASKVMKSLLGHLQDCD
jgi:hypothetical protein